MATGSRKFQAPKGTRDFYPADLAVRRHIENAWRQTSINHGFEEIDGPTFEHLDLYTHKSGPAIASELFQVFSGKDPEQATSIRKGDTAPYALRPEFTPTLARMVAAKAAELPRPIKWFAIPSHFRAEAPQRGRLREFMQWNVDFIGGEAKREELARIDAEVIAVAIHAMSLLGLSRDHLRVRVGNRLYSELALLLAGVTKAQVSDWLDLLDGIFKVPEEGFVERARAISPNVDARLVRKTFLSPFSEFHSNLRELQQTTQHYIQSDLVTQDALDAASFDFVIVKGWLDSQGLGQWIEFAPTIVRGLAYYTGTVFEIIAEGERAIAGGGRYDNLIESFGGPALPACGFGMGDVVLANILKDKGLLRPAEEYLPRPDAFVIAANDDAAAKVPSIVAELRNRGGLHVRQSYKATRNVGKLLGDAGKCRAMYAVILGQELAADPPRIALKNLDSGEQTEVALADLANTLRAATNLPPSLQGTGPGGG